MREVVKGRDRTTRAEGNRTDATARSTTKAKALGVVSVTPRTATVRVKEELPAQSRLGAAARRVAGPRRGAAWTVSRVDTSSSGPLPFCAAGRDATRHGIMGHVSEALAEPSGGALLVETHSGPRRPGLHALR